MAPRDDRLGRIWGDPGLRTIGQLIQERQRAVQEIARLRKELDRQRSTVPGKRPLQNRKDPVGLRSHSEQSRNPNRLIRMSDLRQMVGLATSSIYRMMRLGRFPQFEHLRKLATAWGFGDIIAGHATLSERSAPSEVG